MPESEQQCHQDYDRQLSVWQYQYLRSHFSPNNSIIIRVNLLSKHTPGFGRLLYTHSQKELMLSTPIYYTMTTTLINKLQGKEIYDKNGNLVKTIKGLADYVLEEMQKKLVKEKIEERKKHSKLN